MSTNFDELANQKPKLKDLHNEAKARRVKDHLTGYHAMNVWYAEFKPRMECLVGAMSTSTASFIKSSQAYDLAYRAISKALGMH